MELPPSGWYPDPYGVPGLLRWWDGSVWTQHTHGGAGADAADGAAPVTAVQQTSVQPAVAPTTVQPAVQPTAVQAAVTRVQPTTVQPTTVQPATGQAGAQPGVQPGGPGPDANGTQVLFLGDDAWTAPGAPGGPGQGERFGYYRAQRRRRMWLMGGLAGGTAVALGLIALVISSLAGSHPSPVAATKTPVKRVAATTPPTPSPTPSVTAPPIPITDATSGLSYTELPNPWLPNCPASLNNVGAAWTTGESAIAGQINGGQTTWYGEACSAPLPQNYGYNGVADLENVATNLTNNITGSFYNPLSHSYQQGVSQPVTVSGHAGWEVPFTVTYTNTQGLPFSSEQGAVVVVDAGSGIAPAVFFVSIPNASSLGAGDVNSLVSSLQLTAPSQPGGGGSPGDGSPGDGGPGGGGPGGGSPGD